MLKSIGAASQTTIYAYDNDGNLANLTDPLSNATSQAFDGLNRLVSVNAPLSSTAAYNYDAHDNRTGVTDPRGLVTTYTFDGLDDLIQLTSPDTGTTVYVVDAAGNRTQQTDAGGIVTQFSYDALDRLTAKTYPASAGENVAYRYDEAAAGDGVGRLTSFSDQSGSTAYVYDTRGNVTQETRVIGGVGYVTAYGYDLADHVIQVTYPSGRIVSYSRDAMGRVTGVTTAVNASATALTVVSSASYTPFGPLTSLTFGNGLQHTRQYDADYRLTALTTTGSGTVQNLAYGYDDDGDITSLTDNRASALSQTLHYDALGRLTGAAGGYGTYGFAYDAAGNRTSLQLTDAGGSIAQNYTYDTASNRLLSLTSGAATRSFGYTAQGNVASDTRSDAVALTLTYNSGNRLAAIANLRQASYTLNALGQRVMKSAAGATPGTTVFHYGRDGTLLAESDGQGNVLREYVGLGGVPLAMAAGGQLYFIHSDHLGTPQRLTDGQQAVVWDAVYHPFGSAGLATAAVANNLRFPGQYFDAESAFHYNAFRDYDPSLGRYIESDPIGLAGGLNTYAYAGGNPVRYADPKGKNPILVGALIFGTLDVGVQLATNGGNLGCVDWKQAGLAALSGGALGAYGELIAEFRAASALLKEARAAANAAESGALPEGSFSIPDWTGYPEGVPIPEGPFRILEGEEYDAARSAAKSANRAIRQADPSLTGQQIHEIQPVKFGGDPTDPANKIPLSPAAHSQVTNWWNNLMRSINGR